MRKKGIMRAAAAMLGTAAIVTSLSACGSDTVTGQSGMLDYAKEYYRNEDLELGSTYYDKSQTLTWLSKDYGFYYRCEAMTFQNKPDDKYDFVRSESVTTEGSGLYAVHWHKGIAVYVMNPKCKQVYFAGPENAFTINITNVPYTSYYPITSSGEYYVYFYDQNGKKMN